MAKKKKNDQNFNFREAFSNKIEWLAQVLPLRIEIPRGAEFFMERLPDELKTLAKMALSTRICEDWTRLPWLLCVMLGFCDTKEQSGKNDPDLAAKLCEMAACLHAAQHAAFRDEWDRLIIHASALTKPAIESFCRREMGEGAAVYRKTREKRIGMAAAAFRMCLLVSAFFGPYGEEGRDQFVVEIPRRTCPKCGRSAWPSPEPFAHPEQGRRFFCPFCGHNYGFAGPAAKIRNPDGSRRNSTQWTADRMGIDRCQICGKKASETEKGILTSHHLTSISKGGLDVPSNILVLCWPCHEDIHRKRGDIPPAKDVCPEREDAGMVVKRKKKKAKPEKPKAAQINDPFDDNAGDPFGDYIPNESLPAASEIPQ